MPNRRLMARGHYAYPASLSLELVEDRWSEGRQPADLTGRLSLSHFTTGSRKGRRRCSAPHPSPNLTRRRPPGSHRLSNRPLL
jgi:hypothetical protein